MPILKAQDAPCWVATIPPEGDELHFATRPLAIAEAVKLPPGAVVTRLPVRCYLAECDGCEYREGEGESAGGHHLPAFEPWHILGDLNDLERVGTDLLCEECRTGVSLTRFTPSPALRALVDVMSAR
jgi:hypothetical protein